MPASLRSRLGLTMVALGVAGAIAAGGAAHAVCARAVAPRAVSAAPSATRDAGAARPAATSTPGAQLAVARVEAMPRVPLPYAMRDWRQVAFDLDALLYDFDAAGPHLPLPWWDRTRVNYPWDCVGLPSFVGSVVAPAGAAHEGITVMGSVLGATVSGIDKSRQGGNDFVRPLQQYHNLASGEDLVLNHTTDDTGHTFWYEITPQVLFTAITSKYPHVEGMREIVARGADRWYDASVALGGGETTLPDFDHTAFDFDSMKAYDSGTWREPDAAAGVAFIEYMSYRHLGAPRYLQAADWAMRFLEGRKVNPVWESLLPYGTYVAARMNAEEGRSYDVGRLLDWCFEPSPTRGDWGVLSGVRWGGYDVSGLSAGMVPTHGYAFAMDTFSQVGALTPLARYDNRYARAIGRYVLNAANAARLFYANALPDDHQSGADWSRALDPAASISYEAVRERREKRDHASADHATALGTIVSGSYRSTAGQNLEYEVLQESIDGRPDALSHIWRIDALTPAKDHYLVFVGRVDDAGDDDDGFEFAFARNPAGPWTSAFTVRPTPADTWATSVVTVHSGPLFIRVTDTDRTPGTTAPDRISVDLLHVQSFPDVSPYAMGDAVNHGWAATDFAVYGAAYVGLLGGIVRTTNVEHLLQLDLLATDYFHAPAFPTWLYYNPHRAPETVRVDVGPLPVDLYDAVSERILARGVAGDTSLAVPADGVVVLTLAPAGGIWRLDGRKLSVDGVVVDYDAVANPSPPDPSVPTALPGSTSSATATGPGTASATAPTTPPATETAPPAATPDATPSRTATAAHVPEATATRPAGVSTIWLPALGRG